MSRIKPIEEWIEEERKRRAESEIGEKIENMKEKIKSSSSIHLHTITISNYNNPKSPQNWKVSGDPPKSAKTGSKKTLEKVS